MATEKSESGKTDSRMMLVSFKGAGREAGGRIHTKASSLGTWSLWLLIF